MNKSFLLALDQGTTSSRTLLIDREGQLLDLAQKEFTQFFPKPGWVEHDPEEIWRTQWQTVEEVLTRNQLTLRDIGGIGITNQRETTVVWDKKTGSPVYPAIVWQDKRTASLCEMLKKDNWEPEIRNKTGLVIDAYFSATKLVWILNEVPGCRERAENGELLFGTIDSWLVWKLTDGMAHVTDQTNASRTMLYNIREQKWDRGILRKLNIPASMLPDVHPSAAGFGVCPFQGQEIPVAGIAGDQQSALFGQGCIEPGTAKNTYGTGCFMLMQTGSEIRESQNGLITTMACNWQNEPQYALEGSVFIAGAALQWLRDSMGMISHIPDSEDIANQVKDQYEVFVVPAFAGLGAPYWDMYSRGAIFGLTRDTRKEHLIKATLESLAYQTRDVLEAMEQDSGFRLKQLKVDGGAVKNNYLMQFQSDLLQTTVERPSNVETTAMGAAFLAGLHLGWWKINDLEQTRKTDRLFVPVMPDNQAENLYLKWKEAVRRSLGWLNAE